MISCLLLLVFIGLCACKTNSTCNSKKVILSAYYPSFDSLDAMSKKADLILQGKVISSKFEMLDVGSNSSTDNPKLNPGGKTNNESLPYTIYTVKIANILKGDTSKGSTIEVKQLGGLDKDSNTQYVEDDSQSLQINSNYVLFLSTYNNLPASLLNPIQGLYTISNNKIIANEKNSIKISEFSELQSLTSK
jgi:hypothetical protein